MSEYFIVANSFAAPFFSDGSTAYQEGDNPVDALNKFTAAYSHPCGLYSAVCYQSADAYHKNEKVLASWNSNHVRLKQEATKGKSVYSEMGHAPGDIEIDGVRHICEDPKAGYAELNQ